MTQEQIEHRCKLVAEHCTYGSAPSRCSRAWCSDPVVQAYYTLYPEGHFFDDDTARFFDSRIGYSRRTPDNSAYLFVSSERFHPSRGEPAARRYSVRRMPIDPQSVIDGKMVETVGEFQAYTSASAARRAIDKLCATEPVAV